MNDILIRRNGMGSTAGSTRNAPTSVSLAGHATRIGMHAPAGHLARRFVQRWPQDAAKVGALIPADPQPT